MKLKKTLKKMLKNTFCSLLALLLFMVAQAIGGDDDTKLTKTISRAYKVPRGAEVEVSNKYGNIIINTWDKDSVKCKVEITAYGKNESAVEKELDRVEIEFVNSRDYLIMETVLDRQSGFFTELMKNIGDYSKTLLNKNKLEINYTVYIPYNSDIEIENKFGDVFTYGLKGDLTLNLAHGNLRADELADANISISFGGAVIRKMEKGLCELKASTLEINDAGSIDIISSSSDIVVMDAHILKLDSRSDKKFTIREADIISGSSQFSKISIRNIRNSLNLELSFSELQMAPVKPGFSSIVLDSRSSDVKIAFYESNYLATYIEAREDYLTLPDENVKVEMRYIDGKDKYLGINGFIGREQKQQSKLNINSDNGEVLIKFVAL